MLSAAKLTCTYLAWMLGRSSYPFYYGMLVGMGVGSDLTPVGATANVLACGILEKHRRPIRRFRGLR